MTLSVGCIRTSAARQQLWCSITMPALCKAMSIDQALAHQEGLTASPANVVSSIYPRTARTLGMSFKIVRIGSIPMQNRRTENARPMSTPVLMYLGGNSLPLTLCLMLRPNRTKLAYLTAQVGAPRMRRIYNSQYGLMRSNGLVRVLRQPAVSLRCLE